MEVTWFYFINEVLLKHGLNLQDDLCLEVAFDMYVSLNEVTWTCVIKNRSGVIRLVFIGHNFTFQSFAFCISRSKNFTVMIEIKSIFSVVFPVLIKKKNCIFPKDIKFININNYLDQMYDLCWCSRVHSSSRCEPHNPWVTGTTRTLVKIIFP